VAAAIDAGDENVPDHIVEGLPQMLGLEPEDAAVPAAAGPGRRDDGEQEGRDVEGRAYFEADVDSRAYFDGDFRDEAVEQGGQDETPVDVGFIPGFL